MNVCQLERSKENFSVALFPLPSDNCTETNNPRFEVPLSQLKTVTIRAITIEKLHQIAAHPLTQRELCILQMIVEGNSNPEIADKLFLTVGTIKTHVRHILYKLNVSDCPLGHCAPRNRTQATVVALRSGLID